MDGVVVVNKPKGYTSHDIVNIIRKELNTKKVGHTGTLDPNATGVLPILIGKGTKISKYLVEHKKTYIATLKLGEKRDTGDIEGKVIEKDILLKHTEKEVVEKVLKSFLGMQTQVPPMYSAIKVNGKKLYEYARKGQAVEIKPREIEIYNIQLISYNEKDEIEFEVECSKGTYIRVLCEDIAKKLGTIGYMKELVRTRVDKFDIDKALELDNINEKRIKDNLMKIEDLFLEKEKIELTDKKLELFLNGVCLTQEYNDGIYRIYNKNTFIGLGIIKEFLLKRDIVI